MVSTLLLHAFDRKVPGLRFLKSIQVIRQQSGIRPVPSLPPGSSLCEVIYDTMSEFISSRYTLRMQVEQREWNGEPVSW